ncbi:MAG: glycosyltransferase family 2 protein [bacterium]
MDLSIIIVNWNVRDLLERCLASIYKETQNLDFEVIVVDNASSDGSVEMIKENFPQVRLLINKENRWFAGGNNQGIAAARGELILFLNPDTVVLDNAIGNMAEMMDNNNLSSRAKPRDLFQIENAGKVKRDSSTHKASFGEDALLGRNDNKCDSRMEVGILGCKLLNADMSLQPSCRRLPRLADQALIFLKLHNFFPKLKSVRGYYMSDFKYNETREVEQVMGACLMTRREIIDKIGGLDEKYGSIFEEVDFCRRAGNTPKPLPNPPLKGDGILHLLRGGGRGEVFWKINFTEKAQVIHYKGQSFRQRKIITNQKNFNYAVLRYFRKYKPFWQYLILLFLWPISMALAIADQLMLAAGIRKFKDKFKKREL